MIGYKVARALGRIGDNVEHGAGKIECGTVITPAQFRFVREKFPPFDNLGDSESETSPLTHLDQTAKAPAAVLLPLECMQRGHQGSLSADSRGQARVCRF